LPPIQLREAGVEAPGEDDVAVDSVIVEFGIKDV
jgi:hypothetical protein